ncbi:MAG: hypothetical protein QNJ62_06225 [Methyloceanibacter sp.]|nr:hypothetical protein [Methyloceanibacter sp.]
MSDENGPAPSEGGGDNRSGEVANLTVTPEGEGGAGGNGATDWVAGLQNEDNRTAVAQKKWASVDDVVTSYRELETHSAKNRIPGENATDEEWGTFYDKLGRPEKADGYEFAMPENLPENLPYNEELATGFKNTAHEAGLTPKQAQAVHDWFAQEQAGFMQGQIEDEGKRAQEAHDAIVKDWGPTDSEDFKRNSELTQRAIDNLGGAALRKDLVEMGAINDKGDIYRPEVIKALAKVGNELFAEDMLFSSRGSGPNPFSDDSVSMTKQGEIIKANPKLAANLIRAAGKNPKEWGL